jgi:hypothetical protein
MLAGRVSYILAISYPYIKISPPKNGTNEQSSLCIRSEKWVLMETNNAELHSTREAWAVAPAS